MNSQNVVKDHATQILDVTNITTSSKMFKAFVNVVYGAIKIEIKFLNILQKTFRDEKRIQKNRRQYLRTHGKHTQRAKRANKKRS